MTKTSSSLQSQLQESSVSDEIQVRKSKVEYLIKNGISPWPTAKQPLMSTVVARELFESEPDKEHFVAIAGRVMAIRGHGKTMFVQLQDQEGILQAYFKEDVLKGAYALIQQTLDLGDIIYVAGNLFRTKTGEITVQAVNYELLSKCLIISERFLNRCLTAALVIKSK